MVLILDDHPLAREGLCSLIRMHREGEEILQAGTVNEAVNLTDKNDPAMVFIDINLGKESGFAYLEWVSETHPDIKTFVITSSSRQGDFDRAQEYGVDAFVLKDAFVDEIMYGLKVVERGGKFYSATLVDRINKGTQDKNALSVLTERELDVFTLLSQGYSNARISQSLFISEGTTKKHISSILSKLNLHSRVEAVLYASKNSHSVRTAISNSLRRDMRKEGRSHEKKETARQ